MERLDPLPGRRSAAGRGSPGMEVAMAGQTRGMSGWGVGMVIALLLAVLAPGAQSQVQAGIVLDRDGLRSFHLAVGHVYGVPLTTVVRYAPTWLHPEELPVVYMVAREARVSPEVVIALREQGWSWVDITYHLGIGPAIFVHHLPARIGPPYGRAHGYWRKRSRVDYRYLTDRHVIDYVNVYLWAQYHRRPVTEVIVVRERYGDWMRVARSPAWRAAPPPRATQVQGIPSDRGQQARPPRQAVPRGTASSPSRAAPEPSRAAPAPSRAAPAPSRAAPAPNRAAPAPSRAAPAPSRAAPAPSRAAPAPSRAAPAPNRAAPAPSRAAPAPSRAAPAPSRAAPAPSRAAPAPSRASPAPSRAAPAPSRAAPAPSRASPAPSRASPAPQARPAQASSRPAAAPSRPANTRSAAPAAGNRGGSPPRGGGGV
jgi:hypothetical protein